MKKDFIMDGDKVRNCPSNVAKMNLWEVIKYTEIGIDVDWKEYFIALLSAIVIPLYVIFSPICIPVRAYLKRRRDRKFCEKWENRG